MGTRAEKTPHIKVFFGGFRDGYGPLTKKSTTALVKWVLFFHEGHCQVRDKYDLGPQNYLESHEEVSDQFPSLKHLCCKSLSIEKIKVE